MSFSSIANIYFQIIFSKVSAYGKIDWVFCHIDDCHVLMGSVSTVTLILIRMIDRGMIDIKL